MFPMGYLPKASEKIETSMEVYVDWGGSGLGIFCVCLHDCQSHSDNVHDTRINYALKVGVPGTMRFTKQKLKESDSGERPIKKYIGFC